MLAGLLAIASQADAAEPKWTPLFDGKTLTNWKSANFGGEGEVKVADGAIQMAPGVSLTGITYKKEFPKTNYEIELEAQQVDGIDFFCGLTFPVAESHCSFIVGGWAGSVVGLSNIDDKDASDNETTKYMSFKGKQWYHIRLRVEPEKISAWIDGKVVVSQNIKDRKIAIRPEVELSRPLGISAWQTRSSLRNIRYRLLPAKAE